MVSKVCVKCAVEKPMSEYHFKGKGTTRNDCKDCVAEYGRGYRAANKERIRQKKREYTQAKPEIKRASYLRKEYGITLEDYDRMYTEQGGKCMICKTEDVRNGQHKHLHIDHCHEVGHIRGLLCSRCNAGLGHFNDRPELLMAAAGYLAYDKGGGQPLTPVKLATAMKHIGEVHVEGADLCDITGKGSCNS